MTNIHSTFFGRGECVIRGGTREPSFFWQFVKSALDTPSCLERVELLASPAFSTHSSPSVAAFPAAFLLLAGDRTRSGRHYLN